MSEGEGWPRLRLYVVGARTNLDDLQWTRKRLQKSDIDPQLLRDLDRYLRLLEEKPSLLKQLLTFHAGRKRDSKAPDWALHYLVLQKLYGRGSSEAALAEVAKAWSKSPPTIKDAFTDFGHGAKYRLGELLKSFVGKSPGGRNNPDGTYTAWPEWTEKSVLQAMSADLTDRAKSRSGKRSKKSGK